MPNVIDEKMAQIPDVEGGIETLQVMLESSCVLPCTKPIGSFNQPTPTAKIPAKLLEEAAGFARDRQLRLLLLSGPETAFASEYLEAVRDSDAVWLVPWGSPIPPDTEAVYVANLDELETECNATPLVTVRYDWRNLPQLIRHVRRLVAHGVTRVSLVMTDIDALEEGALGDLESQLKELADGCVELYKRGSIVEVDILTDRLLLKEMRNCGAGEKHLTLSPAGEVWACPMFFLKNAADFCYGCFSAQFRLPRKNLELLGFNRAPICQACDAYQCRRCVYLNWEMTKEACVPPRIQCLAANTMRNVSRHLYQRLKEEELFRADLEPIPELKFLDPFDYCTENGFPPPGGIPKLIYKQQELTSDGVTIAKLAEEIAEIKLRLAKLEELPK